jgi:hypothetical protein
MVDAAEAGGCASFAECARRRRGASLERSGAPEVIAKHPASDSISEPVTEAEVSPRAPNATDATPSRRYITLLHRVAGVNAALLIAAVVAATLVFGPRKLSSLAVHAEVLAPVEDPVRGRFGQRLAAVNAASHWVLHR